MLDAPRIFVFLLWFLVGGDAFAPRVAPRGAVVLRGAEVERVAVPSLDARPPEGCAGYIMYIKLFSPEYHTEPVTVRPEEVGIVSLGEEVWDSLKIGVPILGFWLVVIAFLLAYEQASLGR